MLRTCSDDRSAEFSILSVFKINCSLFFATWSSTPARCPRATIARSRFSRREDGTPRIFPRYSGAVIAFCTVRGGDSIVRFFQTHLVSKSPPERRYAQQLMLRSLIQAESRIQSHPRET